MGGTQDTGLRKKNGYNTYMCKAVSKFIELTHSLTEASREVDQVY